MKKPLLVLSSLLLLAACQPQAQKPSGEHPPSVDHQSADHQHHEPLAGASPSSRSIYWLDSAWQTARQEKVPLRHFEGRPVVMTMLYTNCRQSCPLLMNDLKQLEQALGPQESKNVRFVVISIDSNRDTPEALARFARTHQAWQDNWHFLHGTPGQINEIATLLGIRFRQTSPGEYVHSNKLLVLNSLGEVTYQKEDLKEPIKATLSSVQKLLGS